MTGKSDAWVSAARTHTDRVGRSDPTVTSLEEFTCYSDGNAHVICSRKNPHAWIRSVVTVPVRA